MLAPGVASVMVICVVALLTVGNVAVLGPALVIKPPITGAKIWKQSQIVGTSGHVTGPIAYLNNGHVRVSGSTSGDSNIGGWIAFRGPWLFSTTGGSHKITYNWNVTWSSSASSGGTGWVNTEFKLFGNIFDNTTRSWVFGSNGVSGPHVPKVTLFSVSASSWSKSVAGKSYQIVFNLAVNSSHQYLFWTGCWFFQGSTSGGYGLFSISPAALVSVIET